MNVIRNIVYFLSFNSSNDKTVAFHCRGPGFEPEVHEGFVVGGMSLSHIYLRAAITHQCKGYVPEKQHIWQDQSLMG
jgi:hypothetical protein